MALSEMEGVLIVLNVHVVLWLLVLLVEGVAAGVLCKGLVVVKVC